MSNNIEFPDALFSLITTKNNLHADLIDHQWAIEHVSVVLGIELKENYTPQEFVTKAVNEILHLKALARIDEK